MNAKPRSPHEPQTGTHTPMRRTCIRRNALALLITVAALTSTATADCLLDSEGHAVCGQGQCAADWYNKPFCAGFGGGALRDQDGNVKCGLGACAWDDHQQVWCSRVRGGSALRDNDGRVVCYGGCEAGSTERCTTAK